jgi:hypothetical protein
MKDRRGHEVRALLWRKWSGEPPLTPDEEQAFAAITPEEWWDEWAQRVNLLMDEAPGFLDPELEDYRVAGGGDDV